MVSKQCVLKWARQGVGFVGLLAAASASQATVTVGDRGCTPQTPIASLHQAGVTVTECLVEGVQPATLFDVSNQSAIDITAFAISTTAGAETPVFTTLEDWYGVRLSASAWNSGSFRSLGAFGDVFGPGEQAAVLFFSSASQPEPGGLPSTIGGGSALAAGSDYEGRFGIGAMPASHFIAFTGSGASLAPIASSYMSLSPVPEPSPAALWLAGVAVVAAVAVRRRAPF